MIPQSSSSNIAVSLADMVPLLTDAMRHKRAWLDDFSDDVVHVPKDLYEVLVAYRHLLHQ
jgi:hypothetical protein